jgi:2-polyprenyl-3-methyl-5-hydroxy-6-metoxy-1,4-benzoquinol methylase
MVARALRELGVAKGDVLDVGCGAGPLWKYVRDCFTTYTGADIVAYDGFPTEGRFLAINLETGTIPLPAGSFDVVAAVETIEHVDGPRRFVRELVRLVKPGGWLIVTTPNQLSAHSLLSLLLLGCFGAFLKAPGLYPAHVTALLEIDLLRIAGEQGLRDARIRYSDHGLICLTRWHWPWPLRGRWFSDNVLLAAQLPMVSY